MHAAAREFMVELLTAALWHPSIGDEACFQATAKVLGSLGVPVIPVNEASGNRTCVIGGGHVLSAAGPINNGWDKRRSPFRLPGEHIVNAAGVVAGNPGDDWGYLKRYRYVGVRDEFSAKTLRPWNQNVALVPCPSVLTDPLPESLYPWVFGFELASKMDDYVVVHRHPAAEKFVTGINGTVLVVDPQAWRRYGWHSGGLVLPALHSPEATVTLLKRARAVVTASLHLGILAMAAGTPFVCVGENRTRKCASYFQRAGIHEVCQAAADPVAHAISLKGRIVDARGVEREAALEHLKMVVACL